MSTTKKEGQGEGKEDTDLHVRDIAAQVLHRYRGSTPFAGIVLHFGLQVVIDLLEEMV